jgi:hypothetical protein
VRDRLFELTFFHDALVWLAVAFDAVLEVAVAFRKLSQNFIITCGSITQGNGSAETDHVAGRKAMTGDSICVRCPHDGTCNDVVHS